MCPTSSPPVRATSWSPITGLDTAREVLLQAELIDDQPGDAAVAPVKLLAWLIVALVVGALLVWLASLLVTHYVPARPPAIRARCERQAASVWLSGRPSNACDSAARGPLE